MSALIDIIRFTAARRSSRANQHGGWLSGGTLSAYTAPVPLDSGVAISTQTLLMTFQIPDPAGTVENGVLTVDPMQAAMNIAAGDVAFVRAADRQGVTIGDYDAGTLDSTAAVKLDTLVSVPGQRTKLLSFSVIEG